MKPQENIQIKLLEFFVLEVTARSTADSLDLQPTTAALFYQKIRKMIAYPLQFDSQEMFDGDI